MADRIQKVISLNASVIAIDSKTSTHPLDLISERKICTKTYSITSFVKTSRSNECTYSTSTPPNSRIPLLLLPLLPLELLQVFLGHRDDVAGLVLGGEQGGASVQRGARGGSRQVLPEVLAHGLAFQKFSPEGGGRVEFERCSITAELLTLLSNILLGVEFLMCSPIIKWDRIHT